MRPNTPREQLLQNLLAMASVMLFRSARLLERIETSESQGLTSDIEEWFQESQEAIKSEIASEYAVIPERRKTPREDPIWRAPPPIIELPIIPVEGEKPPSTKAGTYFGV